MKTQEIKYKSLEHNYSILIGNNTINLLPQQIMNICPKTKRIALVVDSKVPTKFINKIKNKLKKYEILFLTFSANEKNKSLKNINFFLNKILAKDFNRSDLIIGIGGGITGDVAGFVASIFKRGINFSIQ